MTPAPNLKDDFATVGDVSTPASSGGGIDGVVEFDPDAVDFEPLLVSGTGKVLSYHSSSFYDYEDDASLASIATPIVRNTSRESKRFLEYAPSRTVRSLALLLMAALFTVMGVTYFALSANDAPVLQTTVAKGRKMDRYIMDAKTIAARREGPLLHNIAFWEPYLILDDSGISANQVLMENSKAVMSNCFGRTTINLHQVDRVSHLFSHKSSASLSAEEDSPEENPPLAVFASDFQQAAVTVFDQSQRGAFVAIIHDPVDIYLERYAGKQSSSHERYYDKDNLLVRHLAGIENSKHDVSQADYNVAKQILSKFILGLCEEPDETLRRLVAIVGDSPGSAIGDESCIREQQRWNKECRKIINTVRRSKDDDKEQILRGIESKHSYDIQLFEYSKDLFREQGVYFEQVAL